MIYQVHIKYRSAFKPRFSKVERSCVSAEERRRGSDENKLETKKHTEEIKKNTTDGVLNQMTTLTLILTPTELHDG